MPHMWMIDGHVNRKLFGYRNLFGNGCRDRLNEAMINEAKKRPRKRTPRGKSPAFYLGDPLPDAEMVMWAALNENKRAKAIQRMEALTKWVTEGDQTEVKKIAADAGVSVTRMYEMRKAWLVNRSLASLGTFAGAPKTRVSKLDGTLRKLLKPVVDRDPSGSVRKLALDLEEASGISSEDMPSHNTFRRYIEEELRRRKQMTMAGDDVMFDCVACTLTPTDPSTLILFVVLDRWTQVVLGAALGAVTDSVRGYATAAEDALFRVGRGDFGRLPWVTKMSRAELVVGLDKERWSNARDEFAVSGIMAPLEPSTNDKRFGRYLRSVTGLRIGTIVITPSITTSASLISQPTNDQVVRLAVEVDEHNALKIQGLEGEGEGGGHPPDDLMKMLKRLSQAI